MWSKLQKRIDPSLISLLERCLQLGAIATTVHHLLCLVRVIQSEVSQVAARSTFGDQGLCLRLALIHLVSDTQDKQNILRRMLNLEFSFTHNIAVLYCDDFCLELSGSLFFDNSLSLSLYRQKKLVFQPRWNFALKHCSFQSKMIQRQESLSAKQCLAFFQMILKSFVPACSQSFCLAPAKRSLGALRSSICAQIKSLIRKMR